MRSKAIEESTLSVILKAMQKENRLALEVSLYTGLRISDVLSIKTQNLHKSSFVVYEQKTGKRKKIVLPARLKNELFQICTVCKCIFSYIIAISFTGKCDTCNVHISFKSIISNI